MPTKTLTTLPADYAVALTTQAGGGSANLWAPNSIITYRFSANVSAEDRVYFRMAMDHWQELTGLTFAETAGAPNVSISFAALSAGTAGQAHRGPTLGGILQIDDGYIGNIQPGGHGYHTVVHELGHTIGLSHPGNYNGDTATPDQAAYYEDAAPFSIMSYWSPDPFSSNDVTQKLGRMPYYQESGSNLSPSVDDAEDYFYFYRSMLRTAMPWDIATAAHYYQEQTGVRVTSDTYFFNSTLTGSVYALTAFQDFAGTIIDHGGYDTLDLSMATEKQIIDLRTATDSGIFKFDGGRFSSILGYRGNLFIPNGTQIEKVFGGSGADYIYARNGVDTTLDGGGGADTLAGGTGDDQLYAGDDSVSDTLSGGGGFDRYLISGGDRVVDHSGASEVTIAGEEGNQADIDLASGDDKVAVVGVIDVEADLGSGRDTYEGGDGTDVVKIVVGGTAAGSGDKVTLGDGNDKVTASLLGGWGDGHDLFDGGDGEDTFIGAFVVDLSVTDLTTGKTSSPALDDHITIINFEHVSFAGTRATVSAWSAPTLTANAITTSSLDDQVAINFDSNFTEVDAGDGDDIVDGDINRQSDHDIESTVDRIITLGGDDDRYIAGAMSRGSHRYDGGTGTDTLDLTRLDDIEWSQGFLDFRSAADRILTFNAVTGALTGKFTWSDPAGGGGSYDFTAQVSGFESYIFDLGGTLRFFGDATTATRITLSGGGFADVQINLRDGDDTVTLLEFRPDAGQPVLLNAGEGEDTLDLSGFVALAARPGSSVNELISIDRQAGQFSWAANFDGQSFTATADIGGFEVFYLPDPPIDDGRTVFIHFKGVDGVDDVRGGARDDFIEAFGGNDLLFGGLGADFLNGGAGDDEMMGGVGNDTYVVDDVGDIIIEAVDGDDGDTVIAANGYVLAAGVGIELLHTDFDDGTAAINLAGNEFAQTITGNAGSNILSDGGGDGVDTLRGLGGNDTYRVGNSAAVILEATGQGTLDVVRALVDYVLETGVAIEEMRTDLFAGTAGIDLTGNELKQTIIGNAGDNILSDGGGAADTLYGFGGNDTYRIGNGAATVKETAGQGFDVVRSSVDYVLKAGVTVEEMRTDLVTGTAGIDLTGNELRQTIVGNAGNNILSDGGAAADTLYGFGGNDTYRVGNSAAIIKETAGQGFDVVRSTVDFVLKAGVSIEELRTDAIAGTTGVDLTGNELAQALVGNAGSNIVDGKGGADKLYGFGGKDFFTFSSPLGGGNIDTIVDFNIADDTIRLENAVFTKLAAVGALSATMFRASSAGTAADASDFVLYDTDDGRLFYDPDGSGGSGRYLFATLTGAPAITAADFQVV